MATAMRVLGAGTRQSLSTSHDAARLLDAALQRCHEELVTVCTMHRSISASVRHTAAKL